jgi:hypothetical protein
MPLHEVSLRFFQMGERGGYRRRSANGGYARGFRREGLVRGVIFLKDTIREGEACLFAIAQKSGVKSTIVQSTEQVVKMTASSDLCTGEVCRTVALSRLSCVSCARKEGGLPPAYPIRVPRP